MRESLTAAATRRVARSAPLRQAVYDTLVELIVRGALLPGRHLVEAELAERLGVSRQPVREALQRLHTDGWVDLRPAQGAFVHAPTAREARQLLSVRALLEAHSARLAAGRATPADVGRLRELQAEGVAALAEGDVGRLVAANSALHGAFAELAGNDVLAHLIALVDRRVRWYYAPVARPRGEDAWAEHAEIIEAVAAGEAERAGELMRRHADSTTDAYRDRRD
ncbi:MULTISPECIES: GntR family transcriptional regulator [unclassified Streptomyces]|uniref:GntR family transcriptional regulator n=1 Tax=unclassified Streptomyces TaxID=2593676 RepID=UPI0004BE4F1C|nr:MULTISPECIES: GntR family transcriptional regulator [unclassified Streptomyces]